MLNIIIIIAEVIAAIVLFVLDDHFKNLYLKEIGFIFFGFFASSSIDLFKNHYGNIRIVVRAFFLRRLRLSFAYLIRIKVGSEYFLVKSKRFDFYQPVGGVFICHNPAIYKELSLVTDDNMTKVLENDLRKILTKPSKVLKVINWFYSQKDREVSPHREFIEELIDTGILSRDTFHKVDFAFIKHVNNGIEYSEHFKCNELKLFEIFEFFPSQAQLAELEKLKEIESDKYIFVNDVAIDRLGYCNQSGKSSNLGSQTKYIIG